MLEWMKKAKAGPDHPMRDASSAAALLTTLRGADPAAALSELTGWLESLKDAGGFDDRVRSEVLALIYEAGTPHVSSLLGRYLTDTAAKHVLREAKWKALFDYAFSLSELLCASAERVIATTKTDSSSSSTSAAGTVHGLLACRALAKLCLVRYLSVPSVVWRLAYSVFSQADIAGCATTSVHPHHGQNTTTTATQELLRLLMLQLSAPEMMAPEQIEVADRVAQQVGSDFTLRPRGVADNPFCFDPQSDLPPWRAASQAPPVEGVRYFGPGTGLDSLTRLYKQLASANVADVKAFGKDISPHAQVAAVEHLLRFWGPKPAASPPVHAPAEAELLVVHRYAQIWQHVPDFESAMKGSIGLGIQPDDDDRPDAPEVWNLRDAGGSELGTDIPQLSGNWAKSGELIGLSRHGSDEWWLGVIRRMHAEPGKNMHVEIGVISRKPLAVPLRVERRANAGDVDSEMSSSLSFRHLNAILLTDVTPADGKQHLLLSPDGWMQGRVYEALVGQPSRYLRLLQLLKRGEDYVRVAFEWMDTPER